MTGLPFPQKSKDQTRPQKDCRPRFFAVFRPVSVFVGFNRFMTGLYANILKLWIGKFIDITISFKTSPRTLRFVKKWCFYKINMVHLLFPKVIYILIHIFSIFWPNIMFLGAFKRVFKGLQKTGLNRSRPVNVNRFFCGLYISKIKRPDRRSGLLWSWSGLLRSFSGHKTGLPNTTHPVLKLITLDGICTLSRLGTNLKWEILQPQA